MANSKCGQDIEILLLRPNSSALLLNVFYLFLFLQIKYMADPDGGFRILEGSTLGVRPKDTAAVQKAREEHETLFKMIALRNQQQPVPVQEPVPLPLPQETRAVQHKRRQHAELFQKIAEEHRLLAEEHKRLAERQSLYS